jgi:hypothetical protein
MSIPRRAKIDSHNLKAISCQDFMAEINMSILEDIDSIAKKNPYAD